MTSFHRPDRGKPLHVTRVWIERSGKWVEAPSYQTSIQSAILSRAGRAAMAQSPWQRAAASEPPLREDSSARVELSVGNHSFGQSSIMDLTYLPNEV